MEEKEIKNQIISELSELKRIEKFLRAEVAELWAHIREIETLPFYTAWLRIARKIRKSTSKRVVSDNKSNLDNHVYSTNLRNADYLFIFSSDSHEIGGLKTAGRLAFDLRDFNSMDVRGLPLYHNPTSENENNFFIKKSDLNDETKLDCIVACGSDTLEKSFELREKYNAKLVLLMMGLDHIFAPTWKESENFLRAIRESDLVICLSPHLAEQAKIYGAKKIKLAPLGFNSDDFFYTGQSKKNKILVPCRTSVEKGLKVLLPAISLIRAQGWEVIGFGDLQDHSQANVFDKFLGRIDAYTLNSELQDAKFLIDPSWIEGLGLVALEAAACGVMPIISSRGDYRNLFIQDDLPFLEIDNFINPQKVLKVLSENQNTLIQLNIASRVSGLTWKKGSEIARTSLIDLINL